MKAYETFDEIEFFMTLAFLLRTKVFYRGVNGMLVFERIRVKMLINGR